MTDYFTGEPLDDTADETESPSEDDSKGGDTQSPPKTSDKSEKRIRDLQSKADAADARANKLQAMLDAAMGGTAGGNAPKTPAPTVTDTGLAVALEMARETVYMQNPALADAGYGPTDLAGNSILEIRSTAAALVKRQEEIATRIRNKVLAEHGLSPEIASAQAPSKRQDVSKMSSEDFKKLTDAVLRGRTT